VLADSWGPFRRAHAQRTGRESPSHRFRVTSHSSSGPRNHATSHHRRRSSAVFEPLSRSVTAAIVVTIVSVTCSTVRSPLVDGHRETRHRRVAVLFLGRFSSAPMSAAFSRGNLAIVIVHCSGYCHPCGTTALASRGI